MCCMFKKELKEFGQNEPMINHGIDASLVKALKKRRNLQDESDFDEADKEIIREHYQNLRQTKKAFIIFELLRDCGDFSTVAKVLNFLITDCHQGHQDQESDKHKVHEEIIRQLDKKPELKAWVINELKTLLSHDEKPGFCTLYCLCLNKPWLNFKRYVIPLASYTFRLISFHLDYWKDLVVFLALRHYCTTVLVRIALNKLQIPDIHFQSFFLENQGKLWNCQ